MICYLENNCSCLKYLEELLIYIFYKFYMNVLSLKISHTFCNSIYITFKGEKGGSSNPITTPPPSPQTLLLFWCRPCLKLSHIGIKGIVRPNIHAHFIPPSPFIISIYLCNPPIRCIYLAVLECFKIIIYLYKCKQSFRKNTLRRKSLNAFFFWTIATDTNHQ